MLPQQGCLLLSNHNDLYDIIIRKDNLLRQIKKFARAKKRFVLCGKGVINREQNIKPVKRQ